MIDEKYIFQDCEVDDINKSIFTSDEDVGLVNEYSVNEFVDIKIIYNSRTDDYYYVAIEPDLEYSFNECEFGEEIDEERVLNYDGLLAEVEENIPLVLANGDLIDTNNKDEIAEYVRDTTRSYLNKDERTIWAYNLIRSSPIKLITAIEERFGEKFDLESNEYFNKLKLQCYRYSDRRYNIPQEIEDIIVYYVERDLVWNQKLQPIFLDDYVEDMHVNAPNKPIEVYHKKYGNIITNIAMTEKELEEYLLSISLQEVGELVSKADPVLKGSLSDGSRIQASYGREVSPEGSTITIRFTGGDPLTPVDLIKFGTFDPAIMAYIWLNMEHEKTVLISGGTASGKTTTMNAISLFIPSDKKIVSIEDTQEMEIPHDNWVKKVTREKASGDVVEIGMKELLKDALRERPNYIAVGEVRGEEAQALFEAINTGHAGIGTMHADTTKEVVDRLEGDAMGVDRSRMDGLGLLLIQRNLYGSERRLIKAEEILGTTVEGNLSGQPSFEFDYDTDEHKQYFEGSDSTVLHEIKTERGWSEEELLEEVENRKHVLEYLVDNDVNYYEDVYNLIQLYNRNPQKVLNLIESDQVIDYLNENKGEFV